MGSHIALKANVILGTTLGLIIPLQLPLDVANTASNGGLSLTACVTAMTAIAIAYISFFAPLGIFFYEGDEDNSVLIRLLWAMLFAGVCIVGSMVLVFVTYGFLGVYAIGGIRATVSVYILAVFVTAGWVPFVFFAGYGLVFLPSGFVLDFVNRPKPLRGEQATAKKEALKEATEEFAK